MSYILHCFVYGRPTSTSVLGRPVCITPSGANVTSGAGQTRHNNSIGVVPIVIIYAISHTLIHTMCLSKYAILPIKLTADARSLQNLSPWNLKSVWIMPSVLTCAVKHCVNTNLFQRCVHVWLNNEVESFVWKTRKFLWLPPVKIGRIHMMLSWMSRSALAQLSLYLNIGTMT